MEEKQISPARIGDTVKVQFTCRLDDGSIFDSSVGREPLQFTIGQSHLIPGLEKSVLGMYPDETKTVEIESEEAFGPYRKELVKVISRDQFPSIVEPEVGMQFQIERPDEDKDIVRVTEVTNSSVTIDANHALAGKSLLFEIKVLEIIPGIQTKSLEFFQKGINFQNEGKLDEAINSYKEALKLNHELTSANYNLAVALHLKGAIEMAVVFYQMTVAQNPNFSEAHFNLGVALKQQGKLDEALQSFKRVLELKPDHAEAPKYIDELSQNKD